MALFGLGGDRGKKVAANADPTHLLPAKHAWCRVCEAQRAFTRSWRRVQPVRQCPCCNTAFEDVGRLYAAFQPQCPRCEEFLEQPQFEYGLCDGCGSKFELMEGAKPGWLPNLAQRREMAKHGKVFKKFP